MEHPNVDMTDQGSSPITGSSRDEDNRNDSDDELRQESLDSTSAFERFKMAVCLEGDLRGATFYEDLVLAKLRPLLVDRNSSEYGRMQGIIPFLFGGITVEQLSSPRRGLCDGCGSSEILSARLCSESGDRVLMTDQRCTKVFESALVVLESLHTIRQKVNRYVERQFLLFQRQ